MPTLRIRSLPRFVHDIVARFDTDEIVAATGVSREDLERWRQGGNHYRPRDEQALYSFCESRQAFDLLREHAGVIPSIDRQRPFAPDAPPLGSDIAPPTVHLVNRPTTLAGLPVNFPFGIGASVLTRNSEAIAFYAERGFDILTYKTVRRVKRDAHNPPNWVFVDSASVEDIAPPFNQPVVGDPRVVPDDLYRVTTANSYGVPSRSPDEWRKDVERAKRSLSSGQILIVSVVATPPVGNVSDAQFEEALIADFVEVAQEAKAAGADIVEANYSCPNTPGDRTGDLYHAPELAGRVSAAVKAAIGSTPFFVKIGYLNRNELDAFVRRNREHVQGIVAINSISMPVVRSDGHTPLFPNSGGFDRRSAGISGEAIRPFAQEVVRNLVDIRARLGANNELAIVAIGGVMTPQHVYEYLDLGADAVESCTAAFINPVIALETRQQFEGTEVKRSHEPEPASLTGDQSGESEQRDGGDERAALASRLRAVFTPMHEAALAELHESDLYPRNRSGATPTALPDVRDLYRTPSRLTAVIEQERAALRTLNRRDDNE